MAVDGLHLPRFGVEVSLVDTSDLAATEAAFTDRTRILFVETPTNPLLKVLVSPGAAPAWEPADTHP